MSLKNFPSLECLLFFDTWTAAHRLLLRVGCQRRWLGHESVAVLLVLFFSVTSCPALQVLLCLLHRSLHSVWVLTHFSLFSFVFVKILHNLTNFFYQIIFLFLESCIPYILMERCISLNDNNSPRIINNAKGCI